MPDNEQPKHLLSALESVTKLLLDKDIQGMIIGGLAASLLGNPRFTNDIDLLILDLDNRLPEFIEKLRRLGIEPRISDPEQFALESRVLLLRHQESGINIDISMGILPFEREAVGRRRFESAFRLQLALPTPEDLIIFKAVSRRPRDIEDIQAIVARHPDLDKGRILSTVREFADVLEMNEVYEDIKLLLER